MQPPTKDAWYVARGGKTFGPYTWEQIAEHASGRRIGRRDKIYDPRSGAWLDSAKVPGLFGPGGVATAPVGLTMAAKVAAGILMGLAIVLATVMSISAWAGGLSLDYLSEIMQESVRFAQEDPQVTTPKATLPPEGLTFKGTFKWESEEGPGLQNLWHEDTCYLWIHTVVGENGTDEVTMCSFDFGTVDGYPTYLVSQSGSHYVFESSERSLVERVRIVVDVTDTGATGTITKINDVASFIGGTFTTKKIPYEQYKTEVLD